MTEFDNEELLLSLWDEEVAAVNDSTLEVISEDEEEPDSWDALHEPVDRRFQSRDSSIVLYRGESRELDERRRANWENKIFISVIRDPLFFLFVNRARDPPLYDPL